MSARGENWWNRPAGMRELLVIAGPLVVSTMSWTIMNFIDRVLLIGYSLEGPGAALGAGVWAFAVICLPLGIAQYVNTFVAQYHGAERHERIGLAVWQGVWIGLATIPVVLATIPLAPWLFAAHGQSTSMASLETVYYQICACGGGAIVLSAALSSFFSGRGQVWIVMVVDCLAAVVNVALDYAWIYGRWGFPEWGVAGAAWATVVALWFKTLVYFVLFLRPVHRLRCGTLRGCRFDREGMGRLLRFGAPSGVPLLVEVTAFGGLILLMGRLGDAALTATSLALNVNNLAFMPVWGVGMATSTLVGQRMGEERPDLAARATWSACLLGAAYMAVLTAVYVWFPDLVLLAHSSMMTDKEFAGLHDTCVILLRFVASYCVLDGLNIIFCSAIKGAGDTRFVMFNTSLWAVLAVTVAWLGIEQGLGLYWCWSVLTAWVGLLGVSYTLRFLQGRWRSMRVIEDVPVLA